MLKPLKLVEHVSFTQLDDEAVLLDLKSGSYYGLNHVGVELINALDHGASLEATINEMSTRYDVPLKQVKNDVNALLKEMIDNKLLIEI